MDENPSKESPQAALGGGEKGGDVKRQTLEKEPRVSKVLLLGGGCAFLTSWAGLYGNFGHDFRLIAAVLMVGASVCAALGSRLELRNHHWTKRWYNGAALGVVGLAGALAIFALVRETLGNDSDLPSRLVSVTPGESINHKDPFQTRFILRNASTKPLYKVTYMAWWSGKDVGWPAFLFVDMDRTIIPELGPSVECSLKTQFSWPVPSPTNTVMNVEVRYRTKPWRREKVEHLKFWMKADESGEYKWFPGGEGETFDQTLAKLAAEPVRVTEAIPWVEIQMNSVQKIDPRTNSGHGIRLVFSAINHGGAPAKNLHVFWGIWDPRESFAKAWSNRQNPDLEREFLLPGNARRYKVEADDNENPSIFDCFGSGQKVFAGTVSYRDFGNHEYIMRIIVAHTNSQIEVRYVGFSGYFKELGIPHARVAKD